MTTYSHRIEIRPGEGGDDAYLFATELADAFCAWMRRHKHTYDRDDSGRTIVICVERGAADRLRLWAGVHRVQREPGGGKRHTSTATVAVLAAGERCGGFDPDDVVWEAHRGGGRGGQHQNTTDSAVRATHVPTGITVHMTGRSQWQNRQAALRELERRVGELAARQAVGEVNQHRTSQIGREPGRAEKDFTHNFQRSEVIVHATGRRLQLKRFATGRF